MSEMVDRVAMAIIANRHLGGWEQAFIAIETMSEPTQAMTLYAEQTYDAVTEFEARSIWRTMIEKALRND